MIGLLIAVVVVLLVGVAVWFAKVAKHPEQTAGHLAAEDEIDSTSDRFYRGVDRPAGPDADDAFGPDGRPEPIDG